MPGPKQLALAHHLLLKAAIRLPLVGATGGFFGIGLFQALVGLYHLCVTHLMRGRLCFDLTVAHPGLTLTRFGEPARSGGVGVAAPASVVDAMQMLQASAMRTFRMLPRWQSSASPMKLPTRDHDDQRR
jgi:hypothetical protein